MSGSIIDKSVSIIADVTQNVLRDHPMDADFSARQIVDDCWRRGVDIRFQQHVVEAVLLGCLSLKGEFDVARMV